MILEILIKWFIPFIAGSIVTFVGSLIKKEKHKNTTIENAVQSLLRDRLIEKYRVHKIRGEMTILDKENIEHLYNEYINLGGNGTIKELFKDLQNINIKVIKEEDEN